jgi:excisionase family DNA binding protein
MMGSNEVSLLEEILERIKSLEKKIELLPFRRDHPEHEEYLTILQAGALTKFSVGTIYKYVSEKSIPFVKKGSKVLFKRSELQKWLETRGSNSVVVVAKKRSDK